MATPKYVMKPGGKTAHIIKNSNDTVCEIISSGTMTVDNVDLMYFDDPCPAPICRHCRLGWIFKPPGSAQKKSLE